MILFAFMDVNTYIFEKDHVDLEHTCIGGTKIEVNANRYTWVWKKSCTKNREKVFEKISLLIDAMNPRLCPVVVIEKAFNKNNIRN